MGQTWSTSLVAPQQGLHKDDKGGNCTSSGGGNGCALAETNNENQGITD